MCDCNNERWVRERLVRALGYLRYPYPREQRSTIVLLASRHGLDGNVCRLEAVYSHCAIAGRELEDVHVHASG